MSAGTVCLPWWAGTAIPILLDRHAGGTGHSEPLNRPAIAGRLQLTLADLRKQINRLPGTLPVVSRHDYHCEPVQAVAVVDGQLVLLPYSVEMVEIELDRTEVRDVPLSYGLVQVGDEATTRRVTLRGPAPAVRNYLTETLARGDHQAAEPWLSRVRAV